MKTRLLLSLFVAGCTQPAPPPPLDGFAPYGGDGRSGGYQGRHILGNLADTYANNGWHVAFGTDAALATGTEVTVFVDGPALVAEDDSGVRYTGSQLEGMVLANATHELTVQAVVNPLLGPPRYELEIRELGAATWEPYCDAATNSYAYAFQGRWNARRYHMGGPEVSFACIESGVAAKCVDWGYRPGSVAGTKAWLDHEACTGMANARYCDTGKPFTRELTPIAIRDFVAGAQPDADDPMEQLPKLLPSDATWPPADGFYYEAAWPARGPAICLTRLRWASLPPGGYCDAELPDPRIYGSDPETRIAFCEDYSVAQLRALGARYLNGSPPMDLRLHTWKSATGDLFTTVSGYVDDTLVIPPHPDYPTRVRGDAILLRTLPGSLDPMTDVIAVFQQYNARTGDRVVALRSATDKGVTDEHALGEREGYLLVTARGSETVRFGLWLHANGTDYVSATTNPDPAAYTLVQWLGYAIATP